MSKEMFDTEILEFSQTLTRYIRIFWAQKQNIEIKSSSQQVSGRSEQIINIDKQRKINFMLPALHQPQARIRHLFIFNLYAIFSKHFVHFISLLIVRKYVNVLSFGMKQIKT